MNNLSTTLHDKVHNWMNMIGFRLNSSDTNNQSKTVTKHYFFETFNCLEKVKTDEPGKAKFMCFDTYGETLKIRSLSDLQTAFYDNISQLK
ncbi:hypothetical protein HH214_10045 [Mucilaginibacter robiniae]|uniref:Uncharacterized protein n=1 Tax=Mucilaginibacter robiniae TaxID=2728022 RepID=A0A7L5E3G5_9SPHI|nr:hypothetical protein [Mucilaginibacter robiniae]QJD96184.1 hypothetical protein HH214_10045 [Mucilaginibacter robiniae]